MSEVIRAVSDGWGLLALCILIIASLAPKMTEGMQPNARAVVFLVLLFSFLFSLWFAFTSSGPMDIKLASFERSKDDDPAIEDLQEEKEGPEGDPTPTSSPSPKPATSGQVRNTSGEMTEEAVEAFPDEEIAEAQIAVDPAELAERIADMKRWITPRLRSYQFNDNNPATLQSFLLSLDPAQPSPGKVTEGACAKYRDNFNMCVWPNTYGKQGVYGFRFSPFGDWSFIQSNETYFEIRK